MDYWLLIAMCYGGGLLVAFLSLLVASFVGRLWILRTFFCVISLLALLAQGGCWHIVVGIGNATGGGGDEWELQKYFVLGLAVCVKARAVPETFEMISDISAKSSPKLSTD